MIDFRYHLVSIVAIFLALTVGIVLGTTMLQDPLLNTLQTETSQLRDQSDELREEKDVADRLSAGADEMAAAYAEDMLTDQLTGTRVVVMEAPGVPEELRDGVVARIEQAGGVVTGRLSFTDKYIDPGQSSFIRELTGQLAEDAEPPRGSAHERAGAELARAVIRSEEELEESSESEEGSEEDGGEEADAGAVLAGFAEAGLLTVQGEPSGKADIGLVLAPAEPFTTATASEPEQDDATPPGNTAFLALANALDAEAGGAVLVGTTTSIEPGGLLAQAREEQAGFTTVDTAGTTTGDVVTTLALAITTEGRSGHYGIGEDADGFLPDPLPQPNEPTRPEDPGDNLQDEDAE
ncbi:hypothetical protein HDA32_001718 [Spinactinospora alkalitolerans]|uniref:Copper transporter n=1 Tax=Spinactinospora alkalitolerans TaxID=687207 RepID=A0A852TRL4_9ACTN|nr:copper transporter [Spinactinospora alkalitolerans]NYE46598.1 hypothetical protein [Spinactinospora alkalitolerans]